MDKNPHLKDWLNVEQYLLSEIDKVKKTPSNVPIQCLEYRLDSVRTLIAGENI